MENLLELVAAYLVELTEKHTKYNDKYFPTLNQNYEGGYNKFTFTDGQKYVKVIIEAGGQKSVHCFIEKSNGDIHKAATFSAPQKNGVRGNLVDTLRPIFCQDFYAKVYNRPLID